MKTIYNYAFKGLCLYILIMVVVMSTSIEIVTYKSDTSIKNANIDKQLQSSFLAKVLESDDSSSIKLKDEVKENIKETIKIIEKEEEEAKKQEKKQEESKQEENKKNTDNKKETNNSNTPTPAPEPVKEEKKPTSNYQYVQPLDTSGMQGTYIDTGAITHYGHDCCSGGKTATGYDISDGRIYYTDPTFGSVRIVAAGRNEFKYGTILRLNGYSSEPVIAIVLDVGGISLKKDYKLDLLVESEAQASKLGVKRNVSIEVLRNGY